MAIATSKVVIHEDRKTCKVAESVGTIPWNDVSDECAFYNAELSKLLYPDAEIDVEAGDKRPPVRLFDTTTLEFPLGMLERVTNALEEQGIGVVVERVAKDPEVGFKFKWKGPEPRDYQVEAVGGAIENRRYGILQLPTGGGKTLVGALLIKQLGLKTLWIVHSADLVRQTANFVEDYLGLKAGMLGAGRKTLKTVTICTAQSLKKNLPYFEAMEWEPDLLLEDEVHHAGAYKTFLALQQINAFYRYGLTATPFRAGGDNIVLEAAYGQVISQVGLAELQERGILSKITVRATEIDAEHAIDKGLSQWQKVYTQGIVEHEARNKAIAEAVKTCREEGRQILVDIDETDHFDPLGQCIVSTKIEETELRTVHGGMSPVEREQIYNQFRAGEINVLIGTVLREGLDLPNTSAVILAGGGKSKIKVLQEIGRGLRAASGKEDCVVWDFVDFQHYLLFEHSQERFKSMTRAGFEVPEGVLRQVQIEDDEDDDDDIAAIRDRQSVARARRQKRGHETEDDGV